MKPMCVFRTMILNYMVGLVSSSKPKLYFHVQRALAYEQFRSQTKVKALDSLVKNFRRIRPPLLHQNTCLTFIKVLWRFIKREKRQIQAQARRVSATSPAQNEVKN